MNGLGRVRCRDQRCNLDRVCGRFASTLIKVYAGAIAHIARQTKNAPMRSSVRAIFTAIFLLSPSTAFSELLEPELNSCSAVSGISECEVRCIRELGPQCLITHVNFVGGGLRSGTELLRARFHTCRNADVDIQVKSLALEIENESQPTGRGVISAHAFSTVGSVETKPKKTTVIEEGQLEGRLSRIPFSMFLNSGEAHMETSLRLEQCGASDGENTCAISGKLVAVTNPNIRCEFQDTTLPGAFRNPSLLLSPGLQNSSKPVGRVGQ